MKKLKVFVFFLYVINIASYAAEKITVELSSDKIKASKEYKGKTYYFCAVYCKKHFTADPAKYVGE